MKNIENEYVILLISRKANNSIYNKGLASNKKDKDYMVSRGVDFKDVTAGKYN